MPVRRALVAALALPVLAAVYLAAFARRGPATRIAVAFGIGGLVFAAAIAVPAGTVGVPPASQAPLTASALGPVVTTGRGLDAPLVVDFDGPMDATSVVGAVSVEPATEVALSWSADGRRLSLEPRGRWQPATFYTVTVGTAARDLDGRNLARPLRAGFLTRAATVARLGAVDQLKDGVGVGSSIAISFDRPVPLGSVSGSFRIVPAVAGEVRTAVDVQGDGDATISDAFVWEPADGLATATKYTVELGGGLLDADGAAVTVPAPLVFTTAAAPSVVRFRPRTSTKDVTLDAVVSVRFSKPMDQASTKAAFGVKVNGKAVAGTVTFAEGDKVLVMEPTAPFPYSATVTLSVAATATAADGTGLDRARTSGFTVIAKPKPAPKPVAKPAPAPPPKPKPTYPVSSSRLSAEKYLLSLINCTRGGGWVLSDGSCSSPGGGTITLLKYDAGISNKVARPYAVKLANAGACDHFYGSTPLQRLRAAGYTGRYWAENLSCAYYTDLRRAAINLVLFFQSEKYWSPQGGHWINMMNGNLDRAGVGLGISNGHMNYVIDFYRP